MRISDWSSDVCSSDLKDEARGAAIAALAEGFGDKLVAVRLNMAGTPWHAADAAALAGVALDYLVLPKVENAAQVEQVYRACGRPVIAMIETVKGSSEELKSELQSLMCI